MVITLDDGSASAMIDSPSQSLICGRTAFCNHDRLSVAGLLRFRPAMMRSSGRMIGAREELYPDGCQAHRRSGVHFSSPDVPAAIGERGAAHGGSVRLMHIKALRGGSRQALDLLRSTLWWISTLPLPFTCCP